LKHKNQIAVVAQLLNGKKVLLDISHPQGKCGYRYLTQYEIDNNTLKVDGKYIWYETPIRTTVEQGVKITFVTIEATPIALNRVFE
jgi:hypothetical protein